MTAFEVGGTKRVAVVAAQIKGSPIAAARLFRKRDYEGAE